MPDCDRCIHWMMSACLRRKLLGPHVGDGTLIQPLLANAHFHHDGHQVIEILSSQGTDFIVTLALDFLPSHVALVRERGGLDVPQQLACTRVAARCIHGHFDRSSRWSSAK